MQGLNYETVPLSVQLEDGSFVLHYFLARGRGSLLPPGGVWEGAHSWRCAPTNENIEENLRAAFADRPVIAWRRLSPGDIPEDRQFRDAWEDDGRGIVHNMSKARAIHLRSLRHERARVLPDLDVQWSRKFAAGLTEEAAAIEVKRQRLRDMPALLAPSLDAAQSIEDLKTITLPE